MDRIEMKTSSVVRRERRTSTQPTLFRDSTRLLPKEERQDKTRQDKRNKQQCLPRASSSRSLLSKKNKRQTRVCKINLAKMHSSVVMVVVVGGDDFTVKPKLPNGFTPNAPPEWNVFKSWRRLTVGRPFQCVVNLSVPPSICCLCEVSWSE